MNVTYTLNDGSKLYGFYWDDFQRGKTTFHSMEVCHEKSRNIETSHPVLCDNNGKYFLYHNEKVYVDNYNYHNISVLIDEIKYGIEHNDRWFVEDNIILTSLMKQSDKFGILIKARVYDAIIPMMGIAIIGDRKTEEKVLYIPKITDTDNPNSWHYKISFQPKDEEIRRFCSSERYYFSDFCSLLKCGSIELIEL